jgi:hypothetical protein
VLLRGIMRVSIFFQVIKVTGLPGYQSYQGYRVIKVIRVTGLSRLPGLPGYRVTGVTMVSNFDTTSLWVAKITSLEGFDSSTSLRSCTSKPDNQLYLAATRW